jgi:hypothetical protein
MKPAKAPHRVDQRALAQVKALMRATGRGPKIKMRLEVVGTTVYEDTMWDSVVESSQAWPFEDEDEAHAFAAQRSSWLESTVVPVVGGDQISTPFTFVYPAP